MNMAEQKAKAKEVVDRLDKYTGYMKQVYKAMLIEYVSNNLSNFSNQFVSENNLNGIDRATITNYIVMKLAPKTYDFTSKQYANAREVLKQYASNIKKYC